MLVAYALGVLIAMPIIGRVVRWHNERQREPRPGQTSALSEAIIWSILWPGAILAATFILILYGFVWTVTKINFKLILRFIRKAITGSYERV